MSLYRLKSWSLRHLSLINKSIVLSIIFDGSPIKCLEIEKIRVAMASSISSSSSTISFFELVL